MAGQLTIDTLKASSGVLATQNGMTGIAKAWVIFDATTGGAGGSSITPIGSFNVSSVIYNSTGDFTINFTTAMPNANYAVSGTAGYQGASNTIGSVAPYNTKTASACEVQSWIYSGGRVLYNFTATSVVIFSS